MNNYSNKELRALATRAARGAYMPWGLAEEAAASVAWLEWHNIPAVDTFVDLLNSNDGLDSADLAPVFGPNEGSAGQNARVCPIVTGSYLSDLRGTTLTDAPLKIESVNAPLLLVPFLVWIAKDLDKYLLVEWGGVQVRVSSDGIEIVTGVDELSFSMRQDITISFTFDAPKLSGKTAARTEVSDRNRMIMERFVHRTLMPESEQSMTSGAGGGQIDDE